MSPELKNFLNKHIADIENEETDKLVYREVIEKSFWMSFWIFCTIAARRCP